MSMKLILEKFEILKAMNSIVKSMNNEDAYFEWINTIPDEADDSEFMDIVTDEDEVIFKEACHLFRNICERYLKDGLYLGAFPGKCVLYGASKDEEDE